MAEYDLNAPVTAAREQKNQMGQMFSGQKQEEQGFLGRFRNAVMGQEGLPSMYDRIGQELGLPQLRQNAQQLQTTMSNIPFTYGKATGGFNVNANQLSRIIGQKTSEMAPTVTATTNALNSAENELSRRIGFEQQQQQKELMPYQTEQSLMSDRLARETTGYTTQMNNELNAIITKMQAGIQISEAEKQRAHELAVLEKQFENQKAILDKQFAFQNSQPQYMAIGEGTTVFDPSTGRPLYTAPKTYKPESSTVIGGGYTPSFMNSGSNSGGISSLWG